jgi:hypothetical protein
VIQSIEQTAETGTYKFLYHAAMEKFEGRYKPGGTVTTKLGN